LIKHVTHMLGVFVVITLFNSAERTPSNDGYNHSKLKELLSGRFEISKREVTNDNYRKMYFLRALSDVDIGAPG